LHTRCSQLANCVCPPPTPELEGPHSEVRLGASTVRPGPTGLGPRFRERERARQCRSRDVRAGSRRGLLSGRTEGRGDAGVPLPRPGGPSPETSASGTPRRGRSPMPHHALDRNLRLSVIVTEGAQLEASPDWTLRGPVQTGLGRV